MLIFFFNHPPTTEIYTLSLHDALPISRVLDGMVSRQAMLLAFERMFVLAGVAFLFVIRSEEHTSELQSRRDLVCRLLLEKKKKCSIPGHNGCETTPLCCSTPPNSDTKE